MHGVLIVGAGYPGQAYRNGARANTGASSWGPGGALGSHEGQLVNPGEKLPPLKNVTPPKARATAYKTALHGFFKNLRPTPFAAAELGFEVAWRLNQMVSGQQFPAPAANMTGGWTKCPPPPTCSPPPGVDIYTGGNSSFCPALLCSQSEALTPNVNAWTELNPNWGWIIRWHLNRQGEPGITGRYSTVDSFNRPNSVRGPANPPQKGPMYFQDPQPKTRPRPAFSPVWQPDPFWAPIPVLPPAVDPLIRPVGSPEPYPVPLPWRVIPMRGPNPWRSPGEQTQTGPRGRTRPRPRPPGWPVTYRPPGQPGPTVVAQPGGPVFEVPPPTGTATRPHPPRPREKEKKVKAPWNHAVRVAVDAATEFCDAVDALWQALATTDGEFDRAKWKKRLAHHDGKKQPTCQAKAAAVWALWDQLDATDAVNNLINNQIEDMFFGAMGNAAKKGRQNTHGFSPNSGQGFQSGPWDNSNPVAPGENPFLPKVDIRNL